MFQRLIGDGVLDLGYATDDGAGVLYRDTQYAESFAENDCSATYFMTRNA